MFNVLIEALFQTSRGTQGFVWPGDAPTRSMMPPLSVHLVFTSMDHIEGGNTSTMLSSRRRLAAPSIDRSG